MRITARQVKQFKITEDLTVRAMAKKYGVGSATVTRWLKDGISAERVSQSELIAGIKANIPNPV